MVSSSSRVVVVARLAPGADPSGACALDAALANLFSRCSKYLLTDRVDEGLDALEAIAPGDFEPRLDDLGRRGFRAATSQRSRRVNDGDALGLSEEAKRRFDAYADDPKMRRKLESLVPNSRKLYEAALERYDEQWKTPFGTCRGRGEACERERAEVRTMETKTRDDARERQVPLHNRVTKVRRARCRPFQ